MHHDHDPVIEPSAGDSDARARRQLARLRFDLHDGPQQDVVLLAEDLRLFGSQLAGALHGHPASERLIGRLDDLQARLVSLDEDLRRISTLLVSPFSQEASFAGAVERLAESFARRTAVIPETALSGELDQLTDSQQITLLALIGEALNNIREHTDATEVRIQVSGQQGAVTASVEDNGSGFDAALTLEESAQNGHLGLVGMHERVQMLGGTTRIESRPGGPTIIFVRLPAIESARLARPGEGG